MVNGTKLRQIYDKTQLNSHEVRHPLCVYNQTRF